VYNPRGGPRKLFKFDRVFGPESTQEEVYEDSKALIRSVLDGAWCSGHLAFPNKILFHQQEEDMARG
jgi:hypothetical protein